MISNQTLQNTIEGLKGITRVDLCVMDTEGKVLASTFTDTEDYESAVVPFVESPADSQVIQGYQFFKIFDEHQLEYILMANGGIDEFYFFLCRVCIIKTHMECSIVFLCKTII